MTASDNPLIVQSDLTVLLETGAPLAKEVRAELARFAELETAPEHVHTYRITPLSLWNAAVAGLTIEHVHSVLTDFAKYPVAPFVLGEVADQMGRYGRLRLITNDETAELNLTSEEIPLLEEISRHKNVAVFLGDRLDDYNFTVRLGDRGALKQTLLALGWPVADEAGFIDGADLGTVAFTADLRSYQKDAVDAWWQEGNVAGGNGVLTLPCGAGKTIIGLSAMVTARTNTLIVCTSISSIRQWMREAVDKTSLTEDDVGEWSGQRKELRPVTMVTYNMLTWANPAVDKDADFLLRFPNLQLFDEQEWGLIIYDEVHLLPAPVFRATARLQAIRRLGLTATLVREDGREGDVFSLIGPKRYDAPWTELEALGWIAPAVCTEVRVALSEESRMSYAIASTRAQFRVAATADEKTPVLDRILEYHKNDQILIIGQFIDQLEEVAAHLDAPLLTGKTAQTTRDEIFDEFRAGNIHVLVVSKIANFSIDLPEVGVAVQLSGQFGSRQEEAQRLGRLLRPKADGGQAHFYSIVTKETEEARFARNRQRFLAEQGYTYEIVEADDPNAPW
jgi:DNA excision repair protein ERCC-3